MKKALPILAIAAALPCTAFAEEKTTSPAPVTMPETIGFELDPVKETGQFSIGANASVLGSGIEAGYRFNDRFGVRGTVASGDFSFTEEFDDNTYDGDIELGGYALMLDYYPTRKNFRLSAGAAKLDHFATFSTSGSTTANGNTYNSTMTVESSFKKDIAPVVSVGFQRPLFGSKFYLSGDLGAMYTGGFNVSGYDSSGNIPQSEIDAETAEIENDLNKMKVSPFISVGIGITF